MLLDAAKAFNSIVTCLRFWNEWACPKNFIQWIKLLYSGPTAWVWINGRTSKPMTICRGKRQVCPLSPLLFVVALELLACTIRQCHAASALCFIQRTLSISLYPDNMVLYVNTSKTHLAPLIREYLKFGRFADLSINWDKSLCLPHWHWPPCPANWRTHWGGGTGPVRYLRIWLHRDPDKIVCSKYGTAIWSPEDKVQRSL